MSDFKDLKHTSYQANIELVDKGLVIHTFGNVSVIDRERSVIAIKPSGVDYDKLTAEDIVIVDLNNNIVEGNLRPSSDTKTHTLLYRNFPKIGGVVHTHSTYAVAWSQAVKPIPVLGTTHADHLAFDVPVTEVMSDEMIKGDYEEETGNQIINTFNELSYEEIEMVLVACHGPFTWGADAAGALESATALEEIARIGWHTLMLEPQAAQLPDVLQKKHFFRKHGSGAYYGQK